MCKQRRWVKLRHIYKTGRNCNTADPPQSLPHSRAQTRATQPMTEMTFQPIQNNAGMFSPFIIKLVICWQYFLNSAVIYSYSFQTFPLSFLLLL